MTKGITIVFESKAHYFAILDDPTAFRAYLQKFYEAYPELKPSWFHEGFKFHRFYTSAKTSIRVRHIKPNNESASIVTVRPSFVLPYFVMLTGVAELILELSISGASHEAIIKTVEVMRETIDCPRVTEEKITRFLRSIGDASVVKTTVKKPDQLSPFVTVDENHSKLGRGKVYLAMVAASGVLLGTSLAMSCSSVALGHAYGQIGSELAELSGYEVKAVSLDGYRATLNAINEVFPGVETHRCFLHSWLAIRDKYSMHLQFDSVKERVWKVYAAKTKRQYGQRVRRLSEFAEAIQNEYLRKLVSKVCDRKDEFATPFEHPGAKRTTNEVDRLMRPVTRFLKQRGKLRGDFEDNNRLIRGLTLVLNFKAFTARTQRKPEGSISPFHSLNGFQYSESWLETLYVARVA